MNKFHAQDHVHQKVSQAISKTSNSSLYQTQIHPWNQPVLSNEGKLSCVLKETTGALMRFELTPDSHSLELDKLITALHHQVFLIHVLI